MTEKQTPLFEADARAALQHERIVAENREHAYHEMRAQNDDYSDAFSALHHAWERAKVHGITPDVSAVFDQHLGGYSHERRIRAARHRRRLTLRAQLAGLRVLAREGVGITQYQIDARIEEIKDLLRQ